MWGNAEALQVLLEAGANADAQNQLSNATPLHVRGGAACWTRVVEAGSSARAEKGRRG